MFWPIKTRVARSDPSSTSDRSNMSEIIATFALLLAVAGILSCAFWTLWKKDLKEMNEAAENEARK